VCGPIRGGVADLTVRCDRVVVVTADDAVHHHNIRRVDGVGRASDVEDPSVGSFGQPGCAE
jgi:hypothetical protein